MLVTSCAAPLHESAPPTDPAVQTVRVPERSVDQIYVFAPWDQQLTTYDPGGGGVVDTSGGGQFYYYGFPTDSSLYTMGDTDALGFVVVDVQPTRVRTVAVAAPDEAIFPLATDGSRAFFTVYTYGERGVESGRRIVRLTGNGEFETYATFAGMTELVDRGVLIGDLLYYSVYNVERDEHAVFSISADEPGATPVLVRSALESGELYAVADTLLTSDGTTITGGDHRYECAAMCWFYEEPAVMVRITAEASELVLSVIDWRTNLLLERVPGIVGFDMEGAQLTAYARDRVQVLALAGADA
jgi:hypothetical protein